MERLDKLLVASGHYTRKEAQDLIRRGRIAVNGIPVTQREEKFPPTVSLTVDGTPLESSTPLWIMLHKPQGYLCATEDNHCATVMDLLPVPYRKRGLFPVGRLDKDTEGLVFLTENGALAHYLLSPAHHVEKTYYATVQGTLTPKDVEAFAKGLLLGDGLQCLPAKLVLLEQGSACNITLTQGKYHQIKRMMASRKTPVTYLKRISFGGIPLDKTLPLGDWRPLTLAELKKLEEISHLSC